MVETVNMESGEYKLLQHSLLFLITHLQDKPERDVQNQMLRIFAANQ